VLAAAGVASRRSAEHLIEEGRVTVDGTIVRVQGMRVDPARARIEVDGRRINVHPDHQYVVLNKPAGFVTTARDPQGRPTVLDLVRSKRRVFSVGRLDADTLGLLLLTTDGELAHRLTHPRYAIPRTYVADVRGKVRSETIERLVRGVHLEDGRAAASAARVLRSSASRSQVEVTMTEGRKHEVRRLLDAVGHPVVSLARIRFGPLRLGTLAIGETRRLTSDEVGRLLAAVGL
jgi:pseudouridine synthase